MSFTKTRRLLQPLTTGTLIESLKKHRKPGFKTVMTMVKLMPEVGCFICYRYADGGVKLFEGHIFINQNLISS